MKQADFLEDQVSRASELRERLCGRELIISAIGQFKRGKSSLINALLGGELLPVGIIPLTTAVMEIRQGNSFRAVVRFTDSSEQEVSRDELLDYVSEQKNPNNQRNVAVVKLWTTSTPFGSGITLVDTPGVGSIHQHNTQTSHTYIEKSDAVLFLLSVDSPVSEMERDFLLKAREHAAKFSFPVNKTDTISEENLKEFLSYCKAVLSEAIGLDVTLYPLSAKTGEGVSCIISNHRELPSLHHEEIIVKREEVAMQERQHVGREVALRYLRARKKDKGIILHEFCATTGYSPPYAAFLLRTYAKRVILGGVTLVPRALWSLASFCPRCEVFFKARGASRPDLLPGPERGSMCTVLRWYRLLSGCITLRESSVERDCRQPCRNSCVLWRDMEPSSRILSLLPSSR